MSEFVAAEKFDHRYVEEGVLSAALVALGFKKQDIKIKVLHDGYEDPYPVFRLTNVEATESRALEVHLPRHLTEVSQVHLVGNYSSHIA